MEPRLSLQIFKRILIASLLLLLFSSLYVEFSGYQPFPQNRAATMSKVTGPVALTGEMVNYFDETHQGYLAMPEAASEGGGIYPSVILIHEWWGLNDDIKELAEQFAQAGYIALAVDLYGEPATTDPLVASQQAGEVRGNPGAAFSNLVAAVKYLRALPEVDDRKLATVGWCFGGQWSLLMAKNNLGVKASVMYYGQFEPEADYSHMRSSIIGHFGSEDAVIDMTDVDAFATNLANTDVDHQIFVYPNVGHGFANLRDGDNLSYSEAAADLAWERTQAFLDEVFTQ